MQEFKKGLFTMLGLMAGMWIGNEFNKWVKGFTTEKCKEVKAEETVTTKTK